MAKKESRRSFLKKGLIGGALLAVAGVGLAKFPGRLTHKPRRVLLVFDEREFAVVAAVAARIVPRPDADPVTLAHRIDESLALQLDEVQHDIKQLVDLFENALTSALLDFRFKPFTRLEPAQQDAALLAWRDSRIALRHSGFLALRKMTTTAYYQDPASWADIGYPGPPSLPK